jgi:LSD1 subclass zinc finger protein
MNVSSILRIMRDRGVSIQVQGDRIVCRPGHLVTDLSETIRRHKAAILAELRRESLPYPDGAGQVKCVYCVALVDGVCRATNQFMYGISLLRACRAYEPRVQGVMN